ncbi:MAG: DEAD/DEAH box helicase, partial [Chthonomonadaceae bacterium]|nr:DEAD/DEAH box helicase [Chthonomonadaceae bacterium]
MTDPVKLVHDVFPNDKVVVHAVAPKPGKTRQLKLSLNEALVAKLANLGIEDFFEHQAEAIEQSLGGQDIVVATSTNSGKSLCYLLPTLQSLLEEPAARALFLFPTKALAQDQAHKLSKLLPPGLLCGTYDGDTKPSSRSAIRRNAHVVVTNPDMLHAGILPQHENWIKFLRSLRYVVIDEAHVYRGVFGSHVGNVLRRLFRLCEWQKSRPRVVACSATVGNPVQLVERLTGRTVSLVSGDTSPNGGRQLVFLEPSEEEDKWSSNTGTAALLAAFVAAGVKSLAFCRSRGAVEQVVKMAIDRLSGFGMDPSLIDAYRGGYLADERRKIEKEFFEGGLTGVVATNALELGVDVGDLDAVILNGYPGTVSSFWQQAGRAGRGQRMGTAVLLPKNDPLEQFLVKHPETLLDQTVESVSVNPKNSHILSAQLKCAAYEKPLDQGELVSFGESEAAQCAMDLVESGEAVWQAQRLFYPSYASPALGVNIRGSSDKSIVLLSGGQPLGEMEDWRAKRYAHIGAVYLHRGVSYVVTDLNLETGTAQLVPEDPPYSTAPNTQYLVQRGHEVQSSESFALMSVTVTSIVNSYSRLSRPGLRRIEEFPLDFPPEVMHSLGVTID